MAIPLDLDRLQEKMKEIEANLIRIRTFLDSIDKEIQTLTVLERTLEENLSVLKRKNVIALAHEYRKAKDDLQRARTRMTFLRIDFDTHQRAFNGNSQALGALKNTYAKELNNVGKNVIVGKFGRKDDR